MPHEHSQHRHHHHHHHQQGHEHEHEAEHEHKHEHEHEHGHGLEHAHEHKDGCQHAHATGWRSLLPHSHALDTRLAADTRSLWLSLIVLVLAFNLQLFGSFIAHSSVLAVEAVHTALDGLTVVLSLVSVMVASRPATTRFTYGFARAELLSALVSIIALALLCVKLFAGAIARLAHWHAGTSAPIHVQGKLVFVAEAITLFANFVIAFVLSRSSASLNIRALRAHVIADSIENIVVLGAGALIWAVPSAAVLDPLLTVFIVILLVVLNYGIAAETVTALLQGAPENASVEALVARTHKVPLVVDVAQVHVWTLTSGSLVGTAVVFVDHDTSLMDAERVRKDVVRVFAQHDCTQVTVQVCLQEDSDDSDHDLELDQGALHMDDSLIGDAGEGQGNLAVC